MVSGVEVGAAIGGLKSALDVLVGLKSTADAVAINDAKIALQGAIIEAQRGLMAMQEAHSANLKRIDELEQDIVRLKDWSAERENYELKDIGSGSFAYAPKAGVGVGQPRIGFAQIASSNAIRAFSSLRGRWVCIRC